MRPISVIFAILSQLLLAAHFLHAGNTFVAGICALLPLLLLVRRPWGTRLVQATLLAAALLWLWTMVDLAEVFEEMGRPARRMMFILTGVAAFNVLSAALLQFRLRNPINGRQASEGVA
jgi:hypothetical protein